MVSLQTASVNFVRPARHNRVNISNHSLLTARLATDRKTRSDAFSLRHESYLAGGYIDVRPNGLFSDADDEKPNSRSIVIYKDTRPVASVRLCTLDTNPALAGWDEIPASRIFPDEVAQLLANAPATGRYAKATEINRLVRHPDFATDYELVFVLFRFVSFLVLKEQSDMMISCVRRNHTPFYKRLNFQTIAGPRRYAGVKFETNLMACPEAGYDANLQNFPVVNSRAQETGCYEGLFRGETVSVFGTNHHA